MESAIIGENIAGFISCIGRGVSGVRVPPKIQESALHNITEINCVNWFGSRVDGGRNLVLRLMGKRHVRSHNSDWSFGTHIPLSLVATGWATTMIRKVERFPSFYVLDFISRRSRQILFDCSFCEKFNMGKWPFRGHLVLGLSRQHFFKDASVRMAKQTS